MGERHHRHSIRLQHYDYSAVGAYFITLCTREKVCLFGDINDGEIILNGLGSIIQNLWNDLPNRYENTELDEYVIMPNHFHGIISIKTNVGTIQNRAIRELPLHISRRKMLLPKIIGYYKMKSSKQINRLRNTHGISVWQRNYYEHIIRNDDELLSIREYIANNPFNWLIDENYKSYI